MNKKSHTKISFVVSVVLHVSIGIGIIYFVSDKETPVQKIVTIPVASFQKEQSKSEVPHEENKPRPRHIPNQPKPSINKTPQTVTKETLHIANKETDNIKQEYIIPVQTQRPQENKDETKEYIDANIAKIRDAIAKYKRYPVSAIKMGCEGVCLISFRLTPLGTIEDIKIVKSSGFTILDRSSTQTVEDAACEMPKPHKSVSLTIPIEYKLN